MPGNVDGAPVRAKRGILGSLRRRSGVPSPVQQQQQRQVCGGLVCSASCFLLGAALSAALLAGPSRAPVRSGVAAPPAGTSRPGYSAVAVSEPAAAASPPGLSVAAFRERGRWNLGNPYLRSAGWGPADFAAAAEGLVVFRGSLSEKVLGKHGWTAERHARFDASPPVARCAPLTRLGAGVTRGDGGKWLCGQAALTPGCIIYSLGSNNEWDFEVAVLAETPCEVFTFDCTSNPPPPDIATPRLHFERVCLGHGGGDTFRTLGELAAARGHATISLLKMDIEGYEFDVVESLWRSALLGGDGGGNPAAAVAAAQALLPAQLTVEVHDASIMRGLAWNCADVCSRSPPPYGKGVALSSGEMLPLFVQLTDLGYVAVSREDNNMCTECVEFTFIRAFV